MLAFIMLSVYQNRFQPKSLANNGNAFSTTAHPCQFSGVWPFPFLTGRKNDDIFTRLESLQSPTEIATYIFALLNKKQKKIQASQKVYEELYQFLIGINNPQKFEAVINEINIYSNNNSRTKHIERMFFHKLDKCDTLARLVLNTVINNPVSSKQLIYNVFDGRFGINYKKNISAFETIDSKLFKAREALNYDIFSFLLKKNEDDLLIRYADKLFQSYLDALDNNQNYSSTLSWIRDTAVSYGSSLFNLLKDQPDRYLNIFKKITLNKHHKPIEMLTNPMSGREINRDYYGGYLKCLKINDAEALSNKSICLIGGGLSPIKSNLSAYNTYVVNIDPLFTKVNLNIADKIIPYNFFDNRTSTALKNKRFDEIWALYSLPFYAFTAKEALEFYTHSLRLLAHNGILRVNPLRAGNNCLRIDAMLNRPILAQLSQAFINELRLYPNLWEVIVPKDRDTLLVKSVGEFNDQQFILKQITQKLLKNPLFANC